MSYLVQASPLTRLFIPGEQAACLADPKRLFDTKLKPFTITIPRPSGALEFEHNKPVIATSILPRSKERQVDEDEVAPVVLWLTNEQNTETDIYGIVEIPIQDNVADAIMAMLYEGEDKQYTSLLLETRKKMAKSIVDARKKADARVMRACGKIYNVVKSTVEAMKKDGKGVYSPSYAEALAMEVMKDLIALRRKPDESAAKLMRGAMAAMEQPV